MSSMGNGKRILLIHRGYRDKNNVNDVHLSTEAPHRGAILLSQEQKSHPKELAVHNKNDYSDNGNYHSS